jgi:hypothetical protein
MRETTRWSQLDPGDSGCSLAHFWRAPRQLGSIAAAL